VKFKSRWHDEHRPLMLREDSEEDRPINPWRLLIFFGVIGLLLLPLLLAGCDDSLRRSMQELRQSEDQEAASNARVECIESMGFPGQDPVLQKILQECIARLTPDEISMIRGTRQC